MPASDPAFLETHPYLTLFGAEPDMLHPAQLLLQGMNRTGVTKHSRMKRELYPSRVFRAQKSNEGSRRTLRVGMRGSTRPIRRTTPSLAPWRRSPDPC